jgi:hypothetical protein
MAPVGRLFLCVNCRAQTVICSACDRGQRYCSPECAAHVRSARVRDAGRRYQHSERGRATHAERMRRCRAKQADVTHQGPIISTGREVSAPVAEPSITPASKTTAMANVEQQPRCHLCGCACSAFVRLGFLRDNGRPRRNTPAPEPAHTIAYSA